MLRSGFDTGAVHVDNTAAGIAAAIRAIQASSAGYRAGAAALRTRKRERWQATKRAIVSRLVQGTEGVSHEAVHREGLW